ncbi:PREDICTED: proclotting enzyme isoform X1 [Ceratosolen solmsi marchali]|uniref:Proclotting enzyme isoform X1 n=1 Tax=Ceratosolen solmsi marchali TaxID=326594 RepID=A0AAJ6YBT9_9HYME|nr:PREDICTED: proclotting enzyme isoform X1 [Ceratosolen solmsi marchali]
MILIDTTYWMDNTGQGFISQAKIDYLRSINVKAKNTCLLIFHISSFSTLKSSKEILVYNFGSSSKVLRFSCNKMLITKPCNYLLIGIVLAFCMDLCRANGKNKNISRDSYSSFSTSNGSPLLNELQTLVNENRNPEQSRRRRYVRFPSLSPGYILESAGLPPLSIQQGRNLGIANVRFGSTGNGQYSNWRQQKSYWRQHSGVSSPVLSADFPLRSNAPVMGHRTPRLIFRDTDFSVTSGNGNNFFQSNQLPDIDEDYRDHRKQLFNEYPRFETESRKEKRPVWKGDDSLCADGRSCEFFLMCWMSAGLLDGSCGGIMYTCCHRTKDAAKASNDYNLIDEPRDQFQSLATDAYLAETTDEDQCGISASKQTAQRRIVGGDEAGFGSFPWQAYIRIGSSRCGGTLVNRYHVVTAGHCVAKASARQVQVTLGDYVVNSATESLPAYTFGVREIRVHPYFKFTPQADRFDVAVLRLDRPVHYMPHIAPICLPSKNEDFLGQYGWAAGWGALQAGSRLRPKTLQAVDVPVIDNRVCERWHRSNGINVVIYDEMMCAGYRGGGKDSCQGDSGGPLMLERTGKWYLIGIVSAGYSCAQPGQPGIYHRVAKTVDWITYVINT